MKPKYIPHTKSPIIVADEPCRIGRSPSATYVGEPVLNSHQYLNNWSQQGQIFTYSAPPDEDVTDIPGASIGLARNGNFYIILGSADKNDTSNPDKLLGGAILPWKYDAHFTSGSPDTWAGEVSCTWQQNGGSAYTLFQYYMESEDPTNVTWGYALPRDMEAWNLYKIPIGATKNFSYNPTTNYTYGTLTTKGIQTAALGVWTMPDWVLQPDQHYWTRTGDNHAYIAPGRCIRGYTGTGDPSLGDLIYYVGDTAQQDSLLWNQQRCLFQWGHPIGVYTASASYVEIGTDARYIVRPQNYREQPNTENLTVHPAVIVTSTGASSGDKAAVKITSYDSTSTYIDDWYVEFYSNSLEFLQYFDGTGAGGLEINAADHSYLKIEIHASSAGSMLLHTVALWQTPEW